MPKFRIPSEDKFAKKISIALAILFGVLLLGTLFLEGDFSHSFMKTIELITHVQADDMENKALSIMISLVGYVTQFYILYIILEYALEGRLRNIFTEVKTLKKISKMKDHYIICGGGRVGQNVADELVKAKKDYVIIEADEMRAKKLKDKNYNVLNQDALDEKDLLKANLQNASWLIAGLGDDGDNILLVLSAKELRPELQIAARANHARIVQKLRHAGASRIVMPEVLGGIKLAQETLQNPEPIEHHEESIDLEKN